MLFVHAINYFTRICRLASVVKALMSARSELRIFNLQIGVTGKKLLMSWLLNTSIESNNIIQYWSSGAAYLWSVFQYHSHSINFVGTMPLTQEHMETWMFEYVQVWVRSCARQAFCRLIFAIHSKALFFKILLIWADWWVVLKSIMLCQGCGKEVYRVMLSRVFEGKMFAQVPWIFNCLARASSNIISEF